MALNNRERFENHMDVSSPETMGDAERVADEDYQDPYDDMFDQKIDEIEWNTQEPERITNESLSSDKQVEAKSTSKDYISLQSPNTPHLSEIQEQTGDIAFESVVDANPQYGEGGVTQTFIRNFGEMIQDGRVRQISINEKGEKVNKPLSESQEFSGIFLKASSTVNNSLVESFLSKNGEYSVEIDLRGLNKEELSQLEQSTNSDPKEIGGFSIEGMPPSFRAKTENIGETENNYGRKYVFDINELSDQEKDEWAQLDDNTIDDQGLARIKENQEKEGRGQPLTDQENSGFYPDGWMQSRELKPGEIFYQLRPLNPEHSSPYVTNSITIDKCREEDGSISLEKLLGKLQIDPGNNTIYTLQAYEYIGGDKSNKNREN